MPTPQSEHAPEIEAAARAIVAWCDVRDGVNFHREGAGWRVDRRARLTADHVARALAGTGPAVGALLGDGDSRTRRVLVDIDAHRGEPQAATDAKLEAVLAALRAHPPLDRAATLVRSRRGRGYHVTIHLAEPAPMADVRRLARGALRSAGLDRDPTVEVYPKADSAAGFGAGPCLPGALTWYRRTGGTWLLDPVTRAPIPLARWPAALGADLAPLGAADLSRLIDRLSPLPRPEPAREPVGEAMGDAYEPPADAASRYPLCGRVDPSGRPWTLAGLRAYLAGGGLSVAGEKPGRGRWTHVVALARCPFQHRHDDAAERDHPTQAAALFDARTGRVGFSCWHSSCGAGAGITWRHVVARIDPDARRAYERLELATGGPAATPLPAEPPPGPAADRPREPRPRDPYARLRARVSQYAQFSPLERQRLRDAARTRRGDGDAAGAIRLDDLACCCQIETLATCAVHGVAHARAIPCNRVRACPWCATHEAAEIEAHLLARWPEEGIAVARLDAPGAAPADLARLRAAATAPYAALAKECRPRWILGDGCVLLLWTPKMRRYVESRGRALPAAARVLARADAVRAVLDAWVSVPRRLAALLHADRVAELASDPWLSGPRVARVGGGRSARAGLPWWGLPQARAAAAEARAEAEANGAPAGDTCPWRDALLRPCRKALTYYATWGPSGREIYRSDDRQPDWRLRRVARRAWPPLGFAAAAASVGASYARAAP